MLVVENTVKDWVWRMSDAEVNFKFSNFPTKGSGNPLKGTQRIFLPETKGFRKVNVYNRYLLRPNQKFKGPALVEERETTTVIGSRSNFSIDKNLNLIIEL